jgi:hypothetical protein
MTRIRRTCLAFALLTTLALLGAGCGGEDPGLTVRGTLVGSLAGGDSSFSFPTETRLYDDRVAPTDGVIAGHCTIRRGAPGTPDVIGLGVSRTGAVAAGFRGLREISVQIDDPSVPRGVVTATFGASETFAGGPSATCGVSLRYDLEASYALLTLTACQLVGTGTDVATLDGELEYAGCDVLAP